MIIYPAVDIKNGRCVRLLQGRFDRETVYGDDPVEIAEKWALMGSKWLHVVDLDGAFEGRPAHTREIAEIVAAVSVPVEVGGGIRSRRDAEALLKLGVKRVIVGTRAVESINELESWAKELGDALAVGVDARGGLVQVKGWKETTGREAVSFAGELAERGVRTIIYTDTATDGMLQGPNLPAVAAVCSATQADIIASGGIRNASDIQALRALDAQNLSGAIVGKALYERHSLLPELIAAASSPP